MQKKSSNILKKPITLIGMPGSGKSFLGKHLASIYKLPFFDTDALMEDQHETSIIDIFKTHGESTFRQYEYQTIETILKNNRACIIATGGGTFVQPEAHSLLLEKTTTIYLKTSIRLLFSRLYQELKKRPLLNAKNLTEQLTSLQAARHLIYQTAHITVDCENEALNVTLSKITSAVNQPLSFNKSTTLNANSIA